jgi:two-component system nitrate/nitrite response regulator NarL
MDLRVFILSDLRIYGEGLADALDRNPRIDVVGAATDLQTTVGAIRDCRPDLVLVDVVAAGGVSSMRDVRRNAPQSQIIAIAVPETDADILEYAEAGISGYVTVNGTLEDLVDAVEGVSRGDIICPERLAATLFRRVEAIASERAALGDSNRLTPRELEVVELVEEGLSNREIAERLCIALPTVKNHLHSIFEKLHVHRRAEAAALMRRDPQLVTPHRGRY